MSVKFFSDNNSFGDWTRQCGSTEAQHQGPLVSEGSICDVAGVCGGELRGGWDGGWGGVKTQVMKRCAVKTKLELLKVLFTSVLTALRTL